MRLKIVNWRIVNCCSNNNYFI